MLSSPERNSFLPEKRPLFCSLLGTTCSIAALMSAMIDPAHSASAHQRSTKSTQHLTTPVLETPPKPGRSPRRPNAIQAKGVGESFSIHGQSHATRRAAALQKTPQSASLLTASQLERLGVQNTKQLARLTPNLYIPNNMPGYSVLNYFIRGIGEIDPQGEPSVGTYLDGVYLPRNMGNMQELLDVADIEVDRGPVVFSGHQSEGGAVRINTLVPTSQRRFVVQTGYGTYNEYQMEGSKNR